MDRDSPALLRGAVAAVPDMVKLAGVGRTLVLECGSDTAPITKSLRVSI